MDIVIKKWDKVSPIQGLDADIVSEFFKKENGNDDRYVVFINDALHAIEFADTTLEEWKEIYSKRYPEPTVDTEDDGDGDT